MGLGRVRLLPVGSSCPRVWCVRRAWPGQADGSSRLESGSVKSTKTEGLTLTPHSLASPSWDTFRGPLCSSKDVSVQTGGCSQAGRRRLGVGPDGAAVPGAAAVRPDGPRAARPLPQIGVRQPHGDSVRASVRSAPHDGEAPNSWASEVPGAGGQVRMVLTHVGPRATRQQQWTAWSLAGTSQAPTLFKGGLPRAPPSSPPGPGPACGLVLPACQQEDKSLPYPWLSEEGLWSADTSSVRKCGGLHGASGPTEEVGPAGEGCPCPCHPL